MIIEIPNFVDKKIIAEIKEKVKPFAEKRHVAYYRDGNVVSISQLNELKELDNKLHAVFNDIYLSIIRPRYCPEYESMDTGYDYHIYHPNQICNLHYDGIMHAINAEITNKIRYASVIVHLNTVEEGGELIFPNHNKKIKTEEGKVVVFPPSSAYWHYTTPSNEPREIIQSWMCYKNLHASLQNEGKGLSYK